MPLNPTTLPLHRQPEATSISISRKAKSVCCLSFILVAAAFAPAHAATLKAIFRFKDTGNGSHSHYAFGNTPASELVQASDGNFYGTTIYGGSGNCPNTPGCGTIFRITPQGELTTLYSFPYNKAAGVAPSGAYPTAGLIQATDGNLYGVAQEGGVLTGGCTYTSGCGTLFRISLAGDFKRLHAFCSGDGCANQPEGTHPAAHLVQLPDTSLCGTTSQGGSQNNGTLFCATLSGTLSTVYVFQPQNGTDGDDPVGALLVGKDGTTLYGTTEGGGANGGVDHGGGTVFAYNNGVMTYLHNFDEGGSSAPGTYYFPMGALIFGADGKLYSTTYSGGAGGCIFSLNTDGTGFAPLYVFNFENNAPSNPAAGLALASDGLMYGTTQGGSIVGAYGAEGTAYRYDPVHAKFTGLADFNGTNGASPGDALVEGVDKYLYGTAPLYGGSDKHGGDAGTVVRLSPPLKK